MGGNTTCSSEKSQQCSPACDLRQLGQPENALLKILLADMPQVYHRTGAGQHNVKQNFTVAHDQMQTRRISAVGKYNTETPGSLKGLGCVPA